MITKEELRAIPDINRRIIRDREQLLYLEEKATSIPSILPDPNKVQTSPKNTAGKYIDAATDLRREIAEREAVLEEYKRLAAEFIATLPTGTDTDRLTVKIMRKRYIDCMNWDDAADVLGYDMSYIQRLERMAIAALDE